MRALELDYRNDRPGRRRAGWLALLLVAAVLTWLGGYRESLLAAAAERKGEVSALAARLQPDGRAETQLGAEVGRAREVLVRLELPWERLFGAVEAATGPDVILLGIDPDPDKGAVRISGEARRYQDVLDYARRLEASEPLGQVYLQSHQVQAQDPERPVRFILASVWRGRP